jgi:HD-GYP domain-containing protein (c-di-GMP phosphodiesterase class II)
MFDHRDVLEILNEDLPLREKLVAIHNTLKCHLPFVARIAVTVYDPKTSILKTYIDSSGTRDPMSHYQSTLDAAPSLKEILRNGRPRVVNNLITFEDGEHEHTRRIGRHGYAASYTLPMFYNGVFFGFVFFNSYETDVFTPEALHQLDLFGHLVSLMIINELSSIRTLVAAVRSATRMTHARDTETGSHLDRMSRYARLIAKALADTHQLDDEYIEHIFMFSPLHDIGKISIPDSILLKPGALNEDEIRHMQTHTLKGREIVDDLLDNFGLDSLQHVDILRNIAEYHHEAINGSGYPEGRHGNDIPLEARIVAVADVFDALTSNRPYKQAWSVDAAFQTLKRLAGEKLDRDCVNALIDNRDSVEKIKAQFMEDYFG